MEKIIEKISEYNVINNIFPGALFIYCMNTFGSWNIKTDSLIIEIMIYYFIGIILSRCGALIVEPIMKKLKILKFVEYDKYIIAEKKDDKIQTLMGVGNMYRTLLATLLLIVLAMEITNVVADYPCVKTVVIVISVFLLFVLLIQAYLRQISFVVARVKANTEEKSNS